LKKIICVTLLVFSGFFLSSALPVYQPAHEYTAAELAALSWFELTLLASEPYAIQGFVFDSDWLMDYYLATDWYGPIHGSSEHIAAAMKFTPKEEADMARFHEAAAALGQSYTSCWNVGPSSYPDYGYYRAVSAAAAPPLELPPAFAALGEGDGISIWSQPAVAPADLLPRGPFAELYEVPAAVTAPLSGEALAAAVAEVARVHAEHDVTGDVYRVFFRPNGTIAYVQALGLGGGDFALSLTPYTVWEAWFDGEGALRLFHPVYKGGGWVSTVAIASFAGDADNTRVRCLIYGNVQKIDMEVRGGPYAEVPFVVNLYAGDDDEGYTRLVGR